MVSLKLQKRLAASVLHLGKEKYGWIPMRRVKYPWPTHVRIFVLFLPFGELCPNDDRSEHSKTSKGRIRHTQTSNGTLQGKVSCSIRGKTKGST